MEILDFFFSNIAFLVAIIWFVASVFSRKQKEEQERQKHPRPVARPIEIEIPWEKAEQESEEPRYVEQEKTYPEDVFEHQPLASEERSSADKIRQRTEELLSQVERIQRKENLRPGERRTSERKSEKRHSFEPTTAALSANQANWIDLSQLERKDIVQGMVWSQVFGLPRAKEPHRTNTYLHSRSRR